MENLLNKQEKVRLNYLDNLKCFAMILVILGHCYFKDLYPLGNTIVHTFHVPIFYLVSGIIFGFKASKTQKLKFNLLSKFKVYMIPYFVFSFLYTIIVTFFNYVVDKKSAINFFYYLITNMFYMNGASTATWFLPCLLFAELLFILEQRYLKKYQIAVVNIIIYLVIVFTPVSSLILRFVLRVLFALVVLSIGYFTYIYKDKIFNIENKILFAILFFLIGLYVLLLKINGYIYLYGMTLGKYPVLGIFEFLSISFALLLIFERFLNKEIKFISYFGSNTLIILCTQQIIIEILWVIDGKTLGLFGKTGMTVPFVLTAVVVLIEFPVIWFCNKYLFFLFGKKKPLKKK